MWANQSTIYPAEGNKWIADIIVPLEHIGPLPMALEPGLAHLFYFECCAEAGLAAGTYTGMLGLSFGDNSSLDVPLTHTVWNMSLPQVANAHLTTVFNLFYAGDIDGATNISAYYNLPTMTTQLKERYFGQLCEQRIPAVDTYTRAKRPSEDFLLLKECGQRLINLLDVSTLLGPTRSHYNQSELDYMLSVLDPIVEQAKSLGILSRG